MWKKCIKRFEGNSSAHCITQIKYDNSVTSNLRLFSETLAYHYTSVSSNTNYNHFFFNHKPQAGNSQALFDSAKIPLTKISKICLSWARQYPGYNAQKLYPNSVDNLLSLFNAISSQNIHPPSRQIVLKSRSLFTWGSRGTGVWNLILQNFFHELKYSRSELQTLLSLSQHQLPLILGEILHKKELESSKKCFVSLCEKGGSVQNTENRTHIINRWLFTQPFLQKYKFRSSPILRFSLNISLPNYPPPQQRYSHSIPTISSQYKVLPFI